MITSPAQPGLTQADMANLWRSSPATMAATLSHEKGQKWIAAPHLRLLSRWVVDAALGRKPRVIINIGPRHGKTEFISKWVPVWFLENWPHKRIMNCGYATDFAEKTGGYVRNLVTTHKDRLTFELAQDSRAKGYWNTMQGGGMLATGIKGQITGHGAHLMVIDDPVKDHQDANSRVARDFVWDWWKNTARSRLEPGGAVIVLMTRWHEDDLVGRLLAEMAKGEGEHWEVLNLPSIAGMVREVDGVPVFPEEWVEDPDRGPDPLGRKPGEALWPARYDRTALDALRRGMAPDAWAAQHQGKPANLISAGNVYKSFSHVSNVSPTLFNPKRPLVWSMDFNVDPMCSTLCQWDEEITPQTVLTNQYRNRISVLQEMCLPNSSTPEMCEAFHERTAPYRAKLEGRVLKVRIYGDRSGNSRKTVGDTDYVAIRNWFKTRREYSVTMHLSTANPAVKDRVNAVNAMLCNAYGECNTTIDPGCKELIKDFREVRWKRDKDGNTTGSIDKSDSERTHVSDAYGYFVEKQFGLRNNSDGGFSHPGILR